MRRRSDDDHGATMRALNKKVFTRARRADSIEVSQTFVLTFFVRRLTNDGV